MLQTTYNIQYQNRDKGKPKIKWKMFPQELVYEFLDEEFNHPINRNVDLGEHETKKLLVVLQKYPKTTWYTIQDMKGKNSLYFIHNILLEEDYKPSREYKKRLNPNMKEVDKKKVLKLLEVGVIYPI